jgi:DNA-binding response OmpR family regulator
MPLSPEHLRSEILSAHILIVEDDFLSRTVLKAMLKKEGFECIDEAENGRIGLEKIQQMPPDIIISDILMPELDGFDLCRHIHANPDPAIARIPILIQTALTQEQDKARIFEAGATDYLTKPLEAREVISRCVLHLERGLILRRLQAFQRYLSEERGGETISHENLEGDFWSFKRLSAAINALLNEIELSHHDLKEAKDKAEKANRLRSEFLASITHDLKTPVHCIQNFS